MELEHYYLKNEELYSLIINYIEDTSDIDDLYLSLIDFFESYNFKKDIYKLSFVIRLISKIAENHYRNEEFFEKIERIILYFTNEIHQFFTNSTIFDIFKGNKRVLVFLLKEKILIMDEYIIDYYDSQFHINFEYEGFFFLPEFEPLLEKNKKLAKMKKKIIGNDPNWFDTFEEKRKIGENGSYLCQLIRKDLVEEFIIYITKNNISFNMPIMPSIFETNSLLLKKSTSMIEYAAFFGAIQIFQYLYFNGVELDSSLWIYAIHSQNAELIHLLEDYYVQPPNDSYEECLIESIKCHHNNIAEYIINNLLEQNEYENKYYETYLSIITNSVNLNYLSLPNDISLLISQPRSIDKLNLSDLCIYLNKFTIPSSVTSIGSGVFKNCNSIKEILIPSSVTSIGSDAFYSCSSLVKISISSSLSSIESGTFQKCCSLTELVIPSSVTSIGDNAFYGCVLLQKISIPSSVIKIGNEAFKNCYSLLKIKLPSSVKILGYNVFYGCISLIEASINSTLKIGNGCFIQCMSLEKIIVDDIKKFCILKRFGICTKVKIEQKGNL